ncbi:MAG: hypothetical protein ACRD3O_15140, partial [Terriglobia bacterium]
MAIHSVYTLSHDDAEARSWLALFRRHGYRELTHLVIERVYWLEGELHPETLLPLLVNPVFQSASHQSALDPARGPII